MIKNIVDIQNNRIIIKDGFFGIDSTNPRAKLQIGDGNSLSTNPILLQVADTLAVIKDGNRKRVGIGKYPEEDLDVDGNIQISAPGQEKITFYDTGHDHEHGKLLYTDDGNGSKFEIFTKNASSGNVEQTFTINNQGAVGIGTNPNFGTPGQIIKSNGTNSIYWDSPNQDVIWTPYVEPFGLANIGGLVTMDNQTAYYSSFYTSSALRYDKILLYTTESTVNFTGHIGVAIFDSNNSAVGTNKLQEGILQYTNSLSSGQELSINFSNPVVLNSNSKYWVAIAIDSNSGSLGIAKSSSVNTDNIHIRKESSTNFTTSGFSSVVSTTNSNLNFWYRLYNSQVSTFNDFTDLSTELSLFEVNGTNVVSRFTINNQGAFGIGTNPNFGTPGQVLTSQGTNSVTWEENRLENLADVNISNATINDLIKWDGTNFINFTPAYLDGSGISDNFLIKLVSGATTQTSFIESSVLNTSTSLQTYIPGDPFSVLAGSIQTEYFSGGSKRRMHLTTSGIETAPGITITTDGRVGIGVVEPQENLDVNGNVKINGLIGIGGANYGTAGQVLTSNGSGSAVGWGNTQNLSFDSTATTGSSNILSSGTIYDQISRDINVFTSDPNYGTGSEFRTGGGTHLIGANNAGTYMISAGYALQTFINGVKIASPLYGGYRDVLVTGGFAPSDDRLKFNERDISNALSVIQRLNPQVYEFAVGGLDCIDRQTEAGFIAQDVENIAEISYAARPPRGHGEDYYHLHYQTILTYAVKAIQEQQTLIENLTTRLAALEARIQ